MQSEKALRERGTRNEDKVKFSVCLRCAREFDRLEA